ncbi:MAG TPA: hypothetical protein VF845_00480, partial [Terriglobales bacterium]
MAGRAAGSLDGEVLLECGQGKVLEVGDHGIGACGTQDFSLGSECEADTANSRGGCGLHSSQGIFDRNQILRGLLQVLGC